MPSQVADIRHCTVHRELRNTQDIRTLLEAAQAFAQLHQDNVAADAILRMTDTVDKVLLEISAQQELLKKVLGRQVNEILAQQKILLHQAHESAIRQNEITLTQVGEQMVQVLKLLDLSGVALNSVVLREEYHDPSDVEVLEVALMEAERTKAVE